MGHGFYLIPIMSEICGALIVCVSRGFIHTVSDGDWHRDSLNLGNKVHQANAIPADDVMTLEDVDTIPTTEEVAKKLIEFLVTRYCT